MWIGSFAVTGQARRNGGRRSLEVLPFAELGGVSGLEWEPGGDSSADPVDRIDGPGGLDAADVEARERWELLGDQRRDLLRGDFDMVVVYQADLARPQLTITRPRPLIRASVWCRCPSRLNGSKIVPVATGALVVGEGRQLGWGAPLGGPSRHVSDPTGVKNGDFDVSKRAILTCQNGRVSTCSSTCRA